MKRVLIVLMAVFFFTSCNNNKGKTTPDTKTTTKDDYSNNDTTKNNVTKDNTNTTNNTTNNSQTSDTKSGGSWTSGQVTEFVNSCDSEAEKEGMDQATAQSYCSCMEQKLEKRYPNADDASGLTGDSPELKQMAQDCLGSKSNDNASSGWSKTDENKFMDVCTGSTPPRLGAARANEYCGCVLAKLKKYYTSYDDANTKMANFTKEQQEEFVKECNQ